MKRRFVVLVLAVSSVAALSGCYAVALTGSTAVVGVSAATGLGVGPQSDMVETEWRSKRDHPIKVDKDWRYRGEWWEHVGEP